MTSQKEAWKCTTYLETWDLHLAHRLVTVRMVIIY